MLRLVQVSLVALVLVTTAGCPWWKDHGPAVKQGIVDCTLAAVKQDAPQFLPAVTAILHGNAPNWQEQLDALIVLGKDAAVCAVYVVLNEFKAKAAPSTQPKVSPELVKRQHEAAAVAERAQQYLTARKWQPK